MVRKRLKSIHTPQRRNRITKAAAEMIAKASGGVPRVINWLCDASLVYGFAQQAKKISTKIVEEVLADRSKFGLVPLQPPGSPRLVNKQQPHPKRKAPDPRSRSSA